MIDLFYELMRDPVAATAALPFVALPSIVFLSAFAEFVFPPYPGDTILLLGFFLAGQGVVPLGLLVACALGGSVLGSLAAYGLGRRIGLDFAFKVLNWRRKKLQPEDVEKLLGRFGEKILLVNRFLPVIRGFMLFAAGALRMRFSQVLLYASVGNVLFVAFLAALGVLGADSWEQLVGQARGVKQALGVAMFVVVALWIAYRFRPLRRLRRTLF